LRYARHAFSPFAGFTRLRPVFAAKLIGGDHQLRGRPERRLQAGIASLGTIIGDPRVKKVATRLRTAQKHMGRADAIMLTEARAFAALTKSAHAAAGSAAKAKSALATCQGK